MLIITFFINNSQNTVNSIGLIFDIIGAFFVAWEVVCQYDGERFSSVNTVDPNNSFRNSESRSPEKYFPAANETQEFKKWEKKKYLKMKAGLVALVLGFILQIVSNWI